MRFKRSLIIPVLAASILIPTLASAASNQTDASSNTAASEQHHAKKQASDHQKKDGKQKLTTIINQYASSTLKDQLTKDLATHDSLMQQLHQSAAFQNNKSQEKSQRDAFYQANKQQIDSIRQQEKDGKLTKQQAHDQIDALPGHPQKQTNTNKEQTRTVHTELQTAVKNKDTVAITTALEKLDQQLQSENQQLQQQLNTAK
ncbi:hypothetical protein [Ectobacillus sp. sgz5001026]|uniref:hypothetical protein n=1 Tax=Ectobacillus sp. sgz5001026 TaxID=3242473 RepID=UPI0036D2CAB9